MRILIAIIGAHCQPEHRQAQRETWLQDLDGRADYKFFLGRPVLPESEAEPAVLYGDFEDGPIRSGGYGWHTRVLRDKVQMLTEYALGRGYDYVLKCDDDTYVRPQQLLASGFEAHDYSGFTERHTVDGVYAYRFALGSGYWLSRRAMQLIAEHGLHRHDAEDYAVGQLLAGNGIHPHHDDRYLQNAQECPTALPPFITAHKIDPVRMRHMYQHDSVSAI
jgi:hypothetical protein